VKVSNFSKLAARSVGAVRSLIAKLR
jgi:hypothetical protein